MSDQQRRDPAVRTLAMPADANPAGDIFGGWLLGQMDIAAGTTAYARAQGRVVSVALDKMSFIAPVLVGDLLSLYAEVVRIGRSSLEVEVEGWVRRTSAPADIKVVQGRFTFVALDAERRPRPVPPEAG